MQPDERDNLLATAEDHLRQGRRDLANEVLVSVVEADPTSAEALSLLGMLRHAEGDRTGALDAFRQLLAIREDIPELHYNIGSILLDLNRADEARDALQRAVELRPDMFQAHNTLGLAWQQLGDHEAAVDSFDAALRYAPDHLPALANLGTALVNLRRGDRAVEVCQMAVQLSGNAPDCCFSLGLALELAGQQQDAVACIEDAVTRCPERTDWQFHLAALRSDPPPASAPAEFVRSLFDGYAARFDQHMQSELKCRIPQLIYAAVQQAGSDRAPDVLDLGCGTGLFGKLIRAEANRLVGVDLSPQMIHAADRRGCYDELHVTANEVYLFQNSTPFDLIAAADVLVYSGDLSEIFRLVRAALRPNGLFAFSAEAAESDDGDDAAADGYRLTATRRYVHSRRYLQQLADRFGFREVSVGREMLRKQSGRDVSGWIVVLAAANA